MALFPLTNSKEIAESFQGLSRRWGSGATSLSRWVGWRGGNGEYELLWRSDVAIWALFNSTKEKNRYWCCFGSTDPNRNDMVGIIVEINLPRESVNRRVAGAFARDDGGAVYLTHSGRIGGGRGGIGKEGFLSFYRGKNIAELAWQDGTRTESIVIGRVDGSRLPVQVAHFVSEVDRFKNAVTSRQGAKSTTALTTSTRFRPEFAGIKSYTTRGAVEAQCDHGIVVSALASELEKRGLKPANDRLRDLFVHDGNGELHLLFEVKTGVDPHCVYHGVGQLMCHGAIQLSAPRRVLVLPGKPSGGLHTSLERIGINLLVYKWESDIPVFDGIADVVATSGAPS